METAARTSKWSDDTLVGTVVAARYRVEKVLAEGGTSRIYRAVQEPLGRPVALKVVRPLKEGESSLAERLVREAAAAASLRHPNVVVIHDTGLLPDGRGYIAMELLDGPSLAQLTRRGPLGARVALDLFQQLLRGLREAHRAGFVHRDMKPANVIVSRDDEGRSVAKLLDFGIVKHVGRPEVVLDGGPRPPESPLAEATELTESGTFLGTPQYVAPEVATGEEADARSDLYGVGVMLYRALTGVLPFDGPTGADIVAAHVNDPVPPMRDRAPGVPVPPGLEAVVRRCLEKRPEDRYPDADSLLAALEDVEHTLFGAAAAEVAPVVTPLTEPSLVAAPVRSRTSPWVWVLAGLAVFGTGGALVAGSVMGWLARGTEPVGVVEVEAGEGAGQVAGEGAATGEGAELGENGGAGEVTVEGERQVWLLLSSTPSGAEVTFGGESLGVTPVARKLAVRADEGVFHVEHDGYHPADLTLDLTGEQAAGDVTLEKIASKARAGGATSGAAGAASGAAGAASGGKAADATAFVVDDVRFTAAEAARALRWVNAATYEQLLSAGVMPRQATILVDTRPFADMAAVAATPFIGEKTVEAIRVAGGR